MTKCCCCDNDCYSHCGLMINHCEECLEKSGFFDSVKKLKKSLKREANEE